MRWIRALVAGAAGLALLFASVMSVAAHRDAGHTLTVHVHATSYTSTQEDPSGNVFAPGDEVYLGGTILSPRSPNDQIGTAALHCAVTGAAGSELLCDVAFTLRAGKITGQTLFDLQTEWTQPTRKLAITGGTGAYRAARGEMTVTTLSSGDESIVFSFAD